MNIGKNTINIIKTKVINFNYHLGAHSNSFIVSKSHESFDLLHHDIIHPYSRILNTEYF